MVFDRHIIMKCRLCLTNTKKSILISSKENIQKYITKFLQLELSPEDPISKIICNSCWVQLDRFQKFCTQIEEAQRTLLNPPTIVAVHERSTRSSDVESIIIVKEEAQSEEVQSEKAQSVEAQSVEAQSEDVETEEDLSEEAESDVAKSEDVQSEEVQSEEDRSEESNENTCDNDEILQCLAADLLKVELFVKEEYNEPADTNSFVPSRILKRKRQENTNLKTKTIEVEEAKENESYSVSRKTRNTTKQQIEEHNTIICKNMKLKCDICSKSLCNFKDLQKHFKLVHKCPGYVICCNKKLLNRCQTVDHINFHNNPQYFKCNECDKTFVSKAGLLSHMQTLIHTPLPPDKYNFFCAECGKGFPTNSTLTKHINQIHSTANNKMCAICFKVIEGIANLKSHMEEHEVIVQPQVQCTHCNIWLKSKKVLEQHMRHHDDTAHSCNICGKIFFSKISIQRHMKYVHQLLPKYHCTICDKEFKRPTSFNRHMTAHTGEVLNTCPYCPKTSNTRSNMCTHLKKLHPEEWEASRLNQKKKLKAK